MAHSLQPGDEVIWLKGVGGGFVFPFQATVVAVTAKRVTITVDDPDERGEGLVTRHVKPSSLQLQKQRSSAAVTRKARRQENVTSPGSFEARYPHIASWVRDGWIEIGHDECGRSFLRALDIGGLVWEGDDQYATLDEALQALDAGIAAWVEENS
jgi:hypothetical protein